MEGGMVSFVYLPKYYNNARFKYSACWMRRKIQKFNLVFK